MSRGSQFRPPRSRVAGSRSPSGKGLTDRRITHDVKIYDDAGHTFANPDPAAPLLRIVGFAYDQASADDAWGRVFTFFDEHLQ